ncbi:Hypothetical protein CAP_1055 [Chondromyces apiculatus DSM 436]|uniref:Uncharacterized protein n=1 Tax=Chondromyces apiculatus DSM 436 TaxID=1192034 RepID=A0A017SVB4_9BACT|nr:Hypothetical protein CAP_1055 [Chondromyces apiculatus DSM 436]
MFKRIHRGRRQFANYDRRLLNSGYLSLDIPAGKSLDYFLDSFH